MHAKIAAYIFRNVREKSLVSAKKRKTNTKENRFLFASRCRSDALAR